MSDVFVEDIQDIESMVATVMQKGNSSGSVMEQAILR